VNGQFYWQNWQCACAVSRDRVVGGHPNHIFGVSDHVEIGPKMAVSRELRGVNVKFLFSNPEKEHSCSEPRRWTYYA